MSAIDILNFYLDLRYDIRKNTTRPYNENIEKEYQKLLETLSPEQEEVLTKYCDEIFASGAETEEFFYRLGIKDGLRLKSTVKSVLEMMS